MVDLTAELPEVRLPPGMVYRSMPVPDLMAPSLETLGRAVETIRLARRRGVFVHCALGYGRTAVVAAAYLLAEGRANGVDEAIECVRACRAGCVFPDSSRCVLGEFAAWIAAPTCECASGRRRSTELEQLVL
jgi:protein-tyrosine phosphatase